MPQLDALTFTGQAVTMAFLTSFFFVFFSSIVLPTLYKIKKTQLYFLSKANKEKSSFPALLFNLFQVQDFIISDSLGTVSQLLDEIQTELDRVELSEDLSKVLGEISEEVLQLNFDSFLTNSDEALEFGKSSVFNFADETDLTDIDDGSN